MYLQKVISKEKFFLNLFFIGGLKVSYENSRIRIRIRIRILSQRHGSPDPGPHQNVMDAEHWLKYWIRIRDLVNSGSGIRDEKSPIRDKHPGSATLEQTLLVTGSFLKNVGTCSITLSDLDP